MELPGTDLLIHLLEEMTELLVRARISPNSITILKGECSEEMLSHRILFVRSLHTGPWKAAQKVYRLLRPEIWKRYDDFGFTGLAEQIALAQELKKLREAFHAGFQTFRAKRVKTVNRHTPSPERGTPEDRAKAAEERKARGDELPTPVQPEHSPPDNMRKDEPEHGDKPPQRVEDARVPGNEEAASEKPVQP